jgi:hypothetical protein
LGGHPVYTVPVPDHGEKCQRDISRKPFIMEMFIMLLAQGHHQLVHRKVDLVFLVKLLEIHDQSPIQYHYRINIV